MRYPFFCLLYSCLFPEAVLRFFFWEGSVDPSNGGESTVSTRGSTASTRKPTSGLQQFGSNSSTKKINNCCQLLLLRVDGVDSSAVGGSTASTRAGGSSRQRGPGGRKRRPGGMGGSMASTRARWAGRRRRASLERGRGSGRQRLPAGRQRVPEGMGRATASTPSFAVGPTASIGGSRASTRGQGQGDGVDPDLGGRGDSVNREVGSVYPRAWAGRRRRPEHGGRGGGGDPISPNKLNNLPIVLRSSGPKQNIET